MTFNSWTYAVFLCGAVLLRFVVPGRLVAPLLLALSFGFYAWGAPADSRHEAPF